MFTKLNEIYSLVYPGNHKAQKKILVRKYNNKSLHNIRRKNVMFEQHKNKSVLNPIDESIEEDIQNIEIMTECFEIVENHSFSDDEFFHVNYND